LEEFKLLSSVAVLRAIYDEKKDIYDVLSEFIRALISERSLQALNSLECTKYIEDEFGFHIPEAIIKSCLRKRLVKSGDLVLERGVYTVTETFKRHSSFDADFSNSKSDYTNVIDRLSIYCSSSALIEINRNELEADFEDYLLRPDKKNKHTSEIANFVLTNENDLEFINKINNIEEGLILYTGIRYSPDLSTLGQWRGDLIVFLDSEHLFSAVGLNGGLYKTIFEDFYKLADEASRNKKGGRITLRFFEETGDEIERFFFAAQKIIAGKSRIDPSKTAMVNICNGCKYESDILAKKTEFYNSLDTLKILREKPTNYYDKPEFNVESVEVVKSIKEEVSSERTPEDIIASILKVFTKINYLRQGQSNIGIDRVASIFLTESWLPQRISFSDTIFEGNGSIPFATNIEFLTEKLWFKLDKGLGGKSGKPASFDPIIRAKLIISSQISRSVSEIYRELSHKLKTGEMDKELAARIHHDICIAPSKPEDVSIDSLAMSKGILDDSYIEKVIKEKTLLEISSSEGLKAIEELKQIKFQKKRELLQHYKKIARRQFFELRVFTYLVIPLVLFSLLFSMYSKSDTALSLVFGLLTVVSFLNGIIRPKKVDIFFWAISKSYYRKSINKALQRTSR
jgi:hypothetical protein